MKRLSGLLTTLIAVLLLAGCASYTIQPVAGKQLRRDWSNNSAAKGYVFYQPELYFLATLTNGPAGQQMVVTPIYLPNPEKAYQLTTFNFLAKSDFEFTFADGWKLTAITDKGDNTTVANTVAGELASVLSTSVAKFGIAPATGGTAFLLKPVFNDQGAITAIEKVPFPALP